ICVRCTVRRHTQDRRFKQAFRTLVESSRDSHGSPTPRCNNEQRMKRMTKQKLVVAILALGMVGLAQADNDDKGKACSLSTLDSLYLFSASGFNIIGGVAQPKAVVELIRFNGDGTLTGGPATASINGTITRSPAGGLGSYT